MFWKYAANLQESTHAEQCNLNRTSTWVFYCKFTVYFQDTFSTELLWMAASDISSLYERIMFKQMSEYFESSSFTKYQCGCGFRKDFSAQHYLVSMLEKWKSATDNKKSLGAFLTDSSKAFDCLSHDLLIVKLNAYGLNMSALRFVHDYLKNRVQTTKINSEYSYWEEVMFGFPQGSILGPLLLIYSYVIYSLLWKTLTLQAMQMITRHRPQEVQLRK